MKEFSIGEIVRAHYNSGTYIGQILEDRGDRMLVEVLAVYKHPLQGDIHNYNQIEGVFFHERKALAFHEKANIKKAAIHPYDEKIPAYGDSLKNAVAELREKLQAKDTPFNRLALEKLDGLEKETYVHLYNL